VTTLTRTSEEITRSGAQRTRPLRKASRPPGLLISCLVLLLLAVAGSGESAQRSKQKNRVRAPRKPAPATAVLDEQVLKTQVMLDRAGFSPGEIDARQGTSTQHALDAFTKNGGKADGGATAPLVEYTITEPDAAGPFTPNLPSDMMEMSKLTALGYRDLLEALGERFHVSPALLKQLNPTAKFAAGEAIQVPNVTETVVSAAPARGRQNDPASPADMVVTVRKSLSDLTVTDGSGKTLMYAPVTTGSEHDPLPIGEWKVTGVQRDPKFNYNPALFWDADSKQAKATIPAGPNNPVGVVWVDITRPHYGLHGTPEPSKIGKTESHGCVRLTNWDALKLASLVKPGTRVVFAE